MTLREALLDQFQISQITAKSYDTRMNDPNVKSNNIRLRQALFLQPDDFYVEFVAKSTDGGNMQVGPSGQESHGKSEYKVQLRFFNVSKVKPDTFNNMPYSQQQDIIKDIIDQCDVKLSCDCPGFYWQGQSEEISRRPPDSALFPFSGHPGSGIWNARHNNHNGMMICKHLYQAKEEIELFIPDMLKMINKGNSSMATVQSREKPLKKPEQPAGTATSETIKSSKAAPPTVAAENSGQQQPISDTDATQEELIGKSGTNATTNVEPKQFDGKTTASTGEEAVEPAIPEPEKSEAAKNHTEELEDENEETLPKENENLKEKYDRILRESSSELSIDDNFLKIVDLFGKISIAFKDIAYNKLIESTKNGKFFVSKIKGYCEEINTYMITIKKQLSEGKKPDLWSLEDLIKGLNESETKSVEAHMKRIFKINSGYDEDKHNFHKVAQMYNYLINRFSNMVDQFNLKVKPKEANFSIYSEYEVSDNELENYDQIIRESQIKKNKILKTPEQSKLFESINQEIITFDEIGEEFSCLTESILDIINDKLVESTKSGSSKRNKVLFHATQLKKLITELNNKIDNNVLIDQDNANSWTEGIEDDNNHILNMQKRILSNKYFDEEDKTLFFQSTHMYANLVSELNLSIQKYNLKNPKHKIFKAQPFIQKIPNQYKIIDNQIKSKLSLQEKDLYHDNYNAKPLFLHSKHKISDKKLEDYDRIIRESIKEGKMILYHRYGISYEGTGIHSKRIYQDDPEQMPKLLMNKEWTFGNNQGSLYGPGLYTTYDFADTISGGNKMRKSNLQENPRLIYGPYIMELEVTNPENILFFDYKAYEEFTGKDSKNFLEDQFNKFDIPQKDFNSKQLRKLKYNSKVALEFVRDIGKDKIGLLVDGIVYNGERDGHCCVIYNKDILKVIGYHTPVKPETLKKQGYDKSHFDGDIKILYKLQESNKPETDDELFQSMYDMTRKEAASFEENMSKYENQDDNDDEEKEEEYNKNHYDGTDDKLPFKQFYNTYRKKYVDIDDDELLEESKILFDIERLNENSALAREYAKIAHDDTGAKRKATGEPYFVHPKGVADIIEAYGGDDDLISIAVLHDTAEDTEVDVQELERMFGPKVAETVSEVTSDLNEIKKIEKELFKGQNESKNKAKEEYLNRKLLNMSQDALAIKIADNYYNSIDHPTSGQKERILRNMKFLAQHRRKTLIKNNVLRRLIHAIESIYGTKLI